MEELLPKKTQVRTGFAGVLGPSGVGFAIAYNNSNPVEYIAVSFTLQMGNSIKLHKLSGVMEVGDVNTGGTWVPRNSQGEKVLDCSYYVLHSALV